MKLIVFAIVALSALGCAAQTQSSCNPEMPRYSEWSASHPFPVALPAAKQRELAAKLSGLSLGLSKEQVKGMVGAPDYVGDGSLQPNAVACMWIYNFADQSLSTEPKDKYMVLLGFDNAGKLEAIAPNHVDGVKPLQVTDESCEPDKSSAVAKIAEVVNEGKAYAASSDRQVKIQTGYQNLAVGMSADQLEGLLGKPDLVVVLPHGHAQGSWFVGEPCKRQMVYILRQSSNNPIDLDTSAIYLSLDERGRLYWAAPQNVGGLKAIGSPVQ
jgi:hypothetical protein